MLLNGQDGIAHILHGVAQGVVVRRLLQAHIGLTLAEVNLGPDAIQTVQRVLHPAGAVGAGHSVDGQGDCIGVVVLVFVCDLHFLLCSLVGPAASAAVPHLVAVAVNRKHADHDDDDNDDDSSDGDDSDDDDSDDDDSDDDD